MYALVLAAALTQAAPSPAFEPAVTVPWREFAPLYRERIERQTRQEYESGETEALVSLADAHYRLRITGTGALGTVAIRGEVISGKAGAIALFGTDTAVTEIVSVENAALVAAADGYRLQPRARGTFTVELGLSIPMAQHRSEPRLRFRVPRAIRNALELELAAGLELAENPRLHRVEQRYFFAPTEELDLELSRTVAPGGRTDDTGQDPTPVPAPDIVLDAVTFFTSYAEDGTALSAIHLELPARGRRELAIEPIPGAEIWSLEVNRKRRNLYRAATGQWIVPLDPEGPSVVVLAYLTQKERLGLEGRLDLELPATGITARRVNVVVGLPERMEMLAMDGDLEPARPDEWAVFGSFSGRPHHFTRPFYRGRPISASILYEEPVSRAGDDAR